MFAGSLFLENPGSIRVGKAQMLRGGKSDPRNKGLMKMFNLTDIGERAGSGVPDICNTWEDNGFEPPQILEALNPDRTTLILSLGVERRESRKTSDKSDEYNREQSFFLYN
jgi:predicted HTH transcriptional regulator